MARNRRRRARRAAVQALYQWELTGQSPGQIETNMPEDSNLDSLDTQYFRGLINGVTNDMSAIDEMIKPGLDRELVDVDPVERAVLRVAVYELNDVPTTPWKVVIDEAVETAKLFGSDNGYRFVNNVLDKIAPTIRTSIGDDAVNAAGDEVAES